MVGVVLLDIKFLAQSHSFLRILNMFLFFFFWHKALLQKSLKILSFSKSHAFFSV